MSQALATMQDVTFVLQTGMGYGMYTLVLPFFAWMIVLVVSAI